MASGKTISLISLIVSAVILFVIINYNFFCNKCECHNSIVISVFSILITILIGWQIYQSIDFEKRVEKIAREVALKTSKDITEISIKEITEYQNRTTGFLQITMSWQYWFNMSDDYNAKKAMNLALETFTKLKEEEQIDYCKKMIEYYKENNPPKRRT